MDVIDFVRARAAASASGKLLATAHETKQNKKTSKTTHKTDRKQNFKTNQKKRKI